MKRNLKTTCITVVLASLFCAPSVSFAQNDEMSSTANESLSALFNCTDIILDAERLTCQDAEILKLKDATESKSLVVFDEKSAKDFKRKSFGLSLPKIDLLGSANPSDETKNVLLTVKSIKTSGRKLTVVMENGQIWQSLDSNYGYIPKKGTIEARIKTAAFGSFLMKLSTDKARSKMIRVRRIK
ncbi:hypothetical protein [Hellea balneolensis]|uniref:hypothetical protein n=1 Tax=Hellea balneolensis TaxID=287478 RepID=UPI00040195CB|nr:hypothetical protein [Hellea balneolensis]